MTCSIEQDLQWTAGIQVSSVQWNTPTNSERSTIVDININIYLQQVTVLFVGILLNIEQDKFFLFAIFLD